ncbi:MAG: SDR family NAD(P)-dependent oxidoreductase [Anaerolineae bacterium]
MPDAGRGRPGSRRRGFGPGVRPIERAFIVTMLSVRDFADEFNSKYDSLHVLVNNAGIFPSKKRLTEDGFEMQFGVNHLAHFLLSNKLLDLLKASCPARIITVSSMMHNNAESLAEVSGQYYDQMRLAKASRGMR